MARYLFISESPVVLQYPALPDLTARLAAAAPFTVWSGYTGGTSYSNNIQNAAGTQLLTTSQLVTDNVGQLPPFRGPDNIGLVWLDFGSGATRVPILSTDAFVNALNAGVDASTALATSNTAISTANTAINLANSLDLRVDTLEAGGGGTGGTGGTTFTGTVDWVTQVTNKPVIPTTAAQVGAIATSARGASNGVASLDATIKIPIAQIPVGTSAGTVRAGNDTSPIVYSQLPAGSTITVTADPVTGTYPGRPTTRTDIVVRWRGTTAPSSGGTGAVSNVDEWVSQ